MNKTDRDLEELTMMFEGGLSIEEAANELQLSPSRLYQILQKHNLPKLIREGREQAVINDYLAHDSSHPLKPPLYTMTAILQRHHISRGTLYHILRRHDIKPGRRDTSFARRTPSEIDAEARLIIQMYHDAGDTVSSIRERTGRSISYIYKVLHANSIPLRTE